jgi:hypothetical protein
MREKYAGVRSSTPSALCPDFSCKEPNPVRCVTVVTLNVEHKDLTETPSLSNVDWINAKGPVYVHLAVICPRIELRTG